MWYWLVLPLALAVLFGPQMVDGIDTTVVYQANTTNLVVDCSYSNFLDWPRRVHVNCSLNCISARSKLHQISLERVGEFQLDCNQRVPLTLNPNRTQMYGFVARKL